MNDAPAARDKEKEFTFEALNMQVGMRIQLLTHRRLKPVPYFSTLVGYIKDEYLIVKTPIDKNSPLGLIEGERLSVRLFSGTKVCSFACTVDKVFDRPILYVHLSFPTSIRGTSLRTAMRVKTDIPVEITMDGEGGEGAVSGLLSNISVSGGRIDLPQPLRGEDAQLRLSMVVPASNRDMRLTVRAQVRNMEASADPDSQANTYSYGVEFIELDPVHHALLQNITYEALLTDRALIV